MLAADAMKTQISPMLAATTGTLRSPHTHTTLGPQPISRMLQGAVVDPFGHIWLIGKILE